MLIKSNNGNWEKSQRTSLVYPEMKIDGGTMFLPVGIVPIQMTVTETDEAGEPISTKEVTGYQFDEYRINKAVGLPEEATTALAEAFELSVSALKIMGVM